MKSKILICAVTLLTLSLAFVLGVPASAANAQVSQSYAQQLMRSYPWSAESLQVQVENCQVVVNYLDQHPQMVRDFYLFNNYLFKLKSDQIIVSDGKSINNSLCNSYPNSGLSTNARIQMCRLVLNYDQWELAHFNENYMTMSSIDISQGFYAVLLNQLTQ
jgi:hypothetical protein